MVSVADVYEEVARQFGADIDPHYFGELVTPEFESNMEHWWADNGAKREQNVHPDPAKYGLALDEVRPFFATYTAGAARWTDR